MRSPASPRGILASALAAFTVAAGVLTLVDGYSAAPLVRAVQFLAVVGLGAIVIGGVVVLALVHLADWRAPEEDFERIVQRAERLASDQPWLDEEDEYGEDEGYLAGLDDWAEEDDYFDFSGEEDFQALVRSALDELPLEFHRALEHVAVVVTEAGGRVRAGRGRRGVYGAYQTDSEAEDYFHDRILVFRDRLLRDFGHDRDLLREQILLTVRRELSQHVGSDGKGIRRR